MARKKRKKVADSGEIIASESISVTNVPPYIDPDEREESITEQTVIGVNKAESLQKTGWQLVSVASLGIDERGLTVKEYKYKRSK